MSNRAAKNYDLNSKPQHCSAPPPSKHKTCTQCCVSAGPALTQHWMNARHGSNICRDHTPRHPGFLLTSGDPRPRSGISAQTRRGRKTPPLCKGKRQYLLTLRVSRYCILPLQSSPGRQCLYTYRRLKQIVPKMVGEGLRGVVLPSPQGREKTAVKVIPRSPTFKPTCKAKGQYLLTFKVRRY